MSGIKIIRFNRIKNKKNFLGYLDIEILGWHLVIKDISVLLFEGKTSFRFPSKKFTKEDGQAAYSNLVYISDKNVYVRFEQSLKQAFDEYCKEHAKEN